MQALTEKIFKLSPPSGLFDKTVIVNLFPDISEGARKQLIHRALEAEEIIGLKRGLYLLSHEYRKSNYHPFVIAAMLHSPSHISFETALSYHGLIPEAVYQVSSGTAARSRDFHTPLGVFTFRRIPLHHPRAGVEIVKLDKYSWAYIAKPLRAIADLIYSRKEISWEVHGLGFLTESMRIEEEELFQLDFSCYTEMMDGLHDRRTVHYLEEMKKELLGIVSR